MQCLCDAWTRPSILMHDCCMASRPTRKCLFVMNTRHLSTDIAMNPLLTCSACGCCLCSLKPLLAVSQCSLGRRWIQLRPRLQLLMPRSLHSGHPNDLLEGHNHPLDLHLPSVSSLCLCSCHHLTVPVTHRCSLRHCCHLSPSAVPASAQC